MGSGEGDMMSSDYQSASEVLQGVQDDRSEALAIVRTWVASLVYGAGWKLDDPEAAIQEVVLRVVRLSRADRIRRDTDFKAFVRTLARHTLADTYRRERLRDRIERSVPIPNERPAPGRDPEEQFVAQERLRMLRFIYQALPEECRRLWRWVYGEGLSVAQVAAHLGISETNVRVRVHRCLAGARTIRGRFAVAAAGGGRRS
jgi:RNA polymerase sigma factor (sigma-70 family)